MASIQSAHERVQAILQGLHGVIAVALLDDTQRDQVVELESRYETSSVFPVKNLGVRLLGQRDASSPF